MPRSFNDFVPGGDIKAIFKGEPATRKTTAAASFPGKTLFFDLDHKIGSLTTPKKLGLVSEHIDYELVNDYEDLKPHLKRMERMNTYDNVVIDSLSNMIDRQLVKWAYSGSKKVRDVNVNELEDWLAEATIITEMMEMIHNISGNVFLICHVWKSEVRGVDGKVQSILRQIVTGGKKVAAKLPSKFNEIWHFDTVADFGSTKYIARFENNENDFARTALGIPPKIDWTGKSFFSCIEQYVNGEEGTLDQIRREQKQQEEAKQAIF